MNVALTTAAKILESKHPEARILLIDDVPEVRQQFSKGLGRVYAEVAAVESAAQARDYLSKNQVDVIVCDLVMPVEDGISFLRGLSKDFSLDCMPALVINTGSITHEGTHKLLVRQLQDAAGNLAPVLSLNNKFENLDVLIKDIDQQLDSLKLRTNERLDTALNIIELGALAKRQTEVITDEFTQVARASLDEIEDQLISLAQKTDFFQSAWSKRELTRYFEKLNELSNIRRSEISDEFPQSNVSSMHRFENKLVAIMPPQKYDFSDSEWSSFTTETKEAVELLRGTYRNLLSRLAEIKEGYRSYISGDFQPLRLVRSLLKEEGNILKLTENSMDREGIKDPDKKLTRLLSGLVNSIEASDYDGECSLSINRVSLEDGCDESFILRAAKKLNTNCFVQLSFYHSDNDEVKSGARNLQQVFSDVCPDFTLLADHCFFRSHSDWGCHTFDLYIKAEPIENPTLPIASAAKTNFSIPNLELLENFNPKLYQHESGPVVCLDFTFDNLRAIAGFYGGKLFGFESQGVMYFAHGDGHAMGALIIAQALGALKHEKEDEIYQRSDAINIFDEGIRINSNHRRNNVVIEMRRGEVSNRALSIFSEFATDYDVSVGVVEGRESGSTFF